MNWNTPTLSLKEYPRFFNIRLLSIVFLSSQIIGLLLGVFIYNCTDPYKVAQNFLFPIAYIFLVFYSLWYCFYSVFVYYKNKNITATHQKWQKWGQKQIGILGNVIYTSAENDIIPFLSNKTFICPDKQYSILSGKLFLKEIFDKIHQDFIKQYPDYQEYLKGIYLLAPYQNQITIDFYKTIISDQWHVPIKILTTTEKITTLFKSQTSIEGIILLLSMQLWNSPKNEQNYSEFITAQLLCSATFPQQYEINLSQLYGYVGRFMTMPIHDMDKSMDHYVEYGLPENIKPKKLWTTNLTNKTNMIVMEHLERQGIDTSSMNNINQAFEEQLGKLAPLIGLSIALEAVYQEQSYHLLLNHDHEELTIGMVSSKIYE